MLPINTPLDATFKARPSSGSINSLVQDLVNGLTTLTTARKQNRVGSEKEQRNFPSCIPRIFSLALFSELFFN